MKIQNFVNHKDQYRVDSTYQRPPNAWSKEDKQCLIDTIIKSEPVPTFFLNHVHQEDIFYIVDGQQRLDAINDFHDNKLTLNKKFSGEGNHGKTFSGDNAISSELKSKFLDYDLTFKIMDGYDDERIRLIFSRLQRGKPLQLGERLNAKPGSIVFRMREIAHHPFMQKSIGVFKGRYGNYPDAARILFYEKHGARQMGSTQLYNFFDNHRDMDENDRSYRGAKTTLNYLAKCFPTSPGNYDCLEKHAWVLAVYAMIRDIKKKYSTTGLEGEIQAFVKSFHIKIYTQSWRSSNPDYQNFYENVRGGWSEKIITLRRDILIEHFIKNVAPKHLDINRQISDEDKIAVFGERNRRCERCDKEFANYSEPEYHHIKHYADGGPTAISNIEMLCSVCHKKAHGKVAASPAISPA